MNLWARRITSLNKNPLANSMQQRQTLANMDNQQNIQCTYNAATFSIQKQCGVREEGGCGKGIGDPNFLYIYTVDPRACTCTYIPDPSLALLSTIFSTSKALGMSITGVIVNPLQVKNPPPENAV